MNRAVVRQFNRTYLVREIHAYEGVWVLADLYREDKMMQGWVRAEDITVLVRA